MIAIVDYGCGNLGSIRNMLKKIGHTSVITSDPEELAKAEKMILPGVGSFDTGIGSLKQSGLSEVMEQKAHVQKVPVLGICLGMQLMTKGSEEGKLPGLGWFDADAKKFPTQVNGEKFAIPNMGWNYITATENARLFRDMYDEPKFYFVHSYYISCRRSEDIAATAHYGIEYVCSFERDNLFGVQFHPEKSHKYGMKLLSNFASL